jgi:hypothetical protein
VSPFAEAYAVTCGQNSVAIQLVSKRARSIPGLTYDDLGVLIVTGEEEMERIFALIEGVGVDLRFLG